MRTSEAILAAAVVALFGCGSAGLPSGMKGLTHAGASGATGGGNSTGTTTAGGTSTGTSAGGGTGAQSGTPVVVSTVPTSGATSIPTNGSVAVVFSEAMDTTTLTTTTLALLNAAQGHVAAQISYDPVNFIATVA